MSIFSKGTIAPSDGRKMATVIGPEAYFQGAITVRGSLRIDGEVEGSIREAEEVFIGSNGRVKGDIAAERVEVSGHVEGDVVASGHIEVHAGGKLIGNIRTATLMIAEGAVFDGQCVMGSSSGEAKARPRSSKKDADGDGESPEDSEEAETVGS